MMEIINTDLGGKDEMFRQRELVLVRNLCPAFLPLSIVEDAGQLYGKTGISGYVRLGDISGLSMAEAGDILKGCFINMELAKDYLFQTGEYELGLNTVYVREDMHQVRFCYKPLRPIISERSQYLRLVDSLVSCSTEDVAEYFGFFREKLEELPLKKARILNALSELRYEYEVVNRGRNRD